jgi:tetratricopeptide (TPR) repeat protein
MAAFPTIRDTWDFSDLAGSRARFEAMAESAAQRGDTEFQAEALTQVGRALGLEQRFDEADAVLDGAEALIADSMPAARTRLLLERGRVRNSSRRPEESVRYFTDALACAESAGLDDLAIDAAHMLGIAEPGADGLAWNERALAMAENTADPVARGWLGSLYNNIGWTYHDLGDHAAAMTMFERAFAFHQERDQDHRAAIARWSVAKMQRFLGQLAQAEAAHRDLLTRPDYQDSDSGGYAHEELAECLLAQGRDDEARPHFARAWQLLHNDPWLSRDEAPRLERLRELGDSPAN